MEGALIRRTSGESSTSLDHSLAIRDVIFLTFSLRNVASIGSAEGMGTDGFLVQGYFEVFPKSSKRSSSNSKGNSEG